jgi:uracil-DNA glycosylase
MQSEEIRGEAELHWRDVISQEREQPYFQVLSAFVEGERAAGKKIYPPDAEVFNALASTPFDRVKVVVIGQDPYHGAGQAHGLSFSVKRGLPAPPSLINIFNELQRDLNLWDDLPNQMPPNGCLESWAAQGVLLLNAVLTVEEAKAGSHANLGWERFTDRVIRELNDKRSGLVFMLWGANAQKKGAFVDRSKHLVLEAPHPSPLSAYRGFIGCGHFSKVNQYLEEKGLGTIEWGAIPK